MTGAAGVRCGASAALLWLGSLTAAIAQESASADALVSAELSRVAAARNLHYSAQLVVVQGNQISLHRLKPDGQVSSEGEQTLGADAAALELSQDGLPVLSLPRRPWQLLADEDSVAKSLRRGYRIEVLPLDVVDGRPALPLWFEPLDRWRYGSTLWIDRASGLVVKTELRNPDGQRLAQSVLTSLQIDVTGSEPLSDAPPAQADLGAEWQVQGMPDGFGMVQVLRDGSGEQLLISDGLAAVSVFIEPLAAGQPGQNGVSQRGLLASIAQIRGDYQLVVIGVVPPPTVERLLNGVTRR